MPRGPAADPPPGRGGPAAEPARRAGFEEGITTAAEGSAGNRSLPATQVRAVAKKLRPGVAAELAVRGLAPGRRGPGRRRRAREAADDDGDDAAGGGAPAPAEEARQKTAARVDGVPRGPAPRRATRAAPGHDAPGLRAAAARAEAVLARAAPHPMGRAARDAQNALDLVGRAAGDAAHARLAARDGPLRHADFAARDARFGQGAVARLGGPLPRTAVGQVRVLRQNRGRGHAEAKGPAPVRALLAAGHARGGRAARRRVAGALRRGAHRSAALRRRRAARARTPLAPRAWTRAWGRPPPETRARGEPLRASPSPSAALRAPGLRVGSVLSCPASRGRRHRRSARAKPPPWCHSGRPARVWGDAPPGGPGAGAHGSRGPPPGDCPRGPRRRVGWFC